ncbi:MAG: methyltransferase regulatory domain-containing protein, partial [Elsteraceae bacterium]
RDLPEMDCIALHGVYSWVSPETRRGIVTFIRKRLKVGGVFYVSYNSLPGWMTAAPLRDMLVAHASGSSAPIDQRFEAAFGFAAKMESAGAKCFLANPTLKARLDMFARMSRTYLSQEYLAYHSHPLYFHEVAEELSAAKLEFVGSAHLTDHVDEVNLTAEQIQLLAEAPNFTAQETLRDFMTNKQFRCDLFVRGPFRLGVTAQLEQLRDMRFALSRTLADTPRKIVSYNGEVWLRPEILRDLGETSGLGEMDVSMVLKAVAVLVGDGALQPSHRHDDAAETLRKRSTERFNGGIMELSRRSDDYAFLASPATCGGLQVDRFDQLFLLARRNQEADAVSFAWNILLAANQRMIRDGALLEDADENIAELRRRFTSFTDERLPLLQRLEVA